MSEVRSLKLGDWFACSWSSFKKNLKTIIGGSIILIFFELIAVCLGKAELLFMDSFTSSQVPVYRILDGISIAMNFVVNPVLYVGYCFLVLKLCRGENARIMDTFSAFSRFWTVLATCWLYMLIIVGGIILLIVPGVVWATKYCLSWFAVMDRRISALKSIRFSGKITHGYKSRLLILILIDLLSTFSWGLPFSSCLERLGDDIGYVLVGVSIITILLHSLLITPLITAAFAVAYDSLSKREETDVV